MIYGLEFAHSFLIFFSPLPVYPFTWDNEQKEHRRYNKAKRIAEHLRVQNSIHYQFPLGCKNMNEF